MRREEAARQAALRSHRHKVEQSTRAGRPRGAGAVLSPMLAGWSQLLEEAVEAELQEVGACVFNGMAAVRACRSVCTGRWESQLLEEAVAAVQKVLATMMGGCFACDCACGCQACMQAVRQQQEQSARR